MYMANHKEPDSELDALVSQIFAAALEVHRTLGPGFVEQVYEEALCMELDLRSIPYTRQHPIAVHYKGRQVGEGRVDVLVDGRLILELKAVETILPVHRAQLISYMRTAHHHLGILINFKAHLMTEGFKRVIVS